MTRLSDSALIAMRLASEEAGGFGTRHWGSEHVLLALAQVDRDRFHSAASILGRLGRTESRIRALLYRHHPPAEAPESEVAAAGPEIGYVVTHARWIAVHLGDRIADTRHLLLGTLWHEKPESRVLRALDLSFEEAYRETTGKDPGPALTPERSVFVPVDQLERLRAALPNVLPEGAQYGFAFDDEFAWFSTNADFDLEHYVQRALSLLSE